MSAAFVQPLAVASGLRFSLRPAPSCGAPARDSPLLPGATFGSRRRAALSPRRAASWPSCPAAAAAGGGATTCSAAAGPPNAGKKPGAAGAKETQLSSNSSSSSSSKEEKKKKKKKKKVEVRGRRGRLGPVDGHEHGLVLRRDELTQQTRQGRSARLKRWATLRDLDLEADLDLGADYNLPYGATPRSAPTAANGAEEEKEEGEEKEDVGLRVVKVWIVAQTVGADVRVVGRATASVPRVCDRCLLPFDEASDGRFEVILSGHAGADSHDAATGSGGSGGGDGGVMNARASDAATAVGNDGRAGSSSSSTAATTTSTTTMRADYNGGSTRSSVGGGSSGSGSSMQQSFAAAGVETEDEFGAEAVVAFGKGIDSVDLSEHVRDAVLLGMPTRALCPDCEGITVAGVDGVTVSYSSVGGGGGGVDKNAGDGDGALLGDSNDSLRELKRRLEQMGK